MTMQMTIHNITFDCADARALAGFWSQLIGWNVYYDDDPEVVVAPHFPMHGGAQLLFIPVPEEKTVKNRLHLDLRPSDQAAEVTRLVSLGARTVEQLEAYLTVDDIELPIEIGRREIKLQHLDLATELAALRFE